MQPLYQITHIRLDNGLDLPPVNTNQSGWYLVFWWKQTPVGQLFIEPNEVLDEAQLQQKSYSAIYATIQVYNPTDSVVDLADQGSTSVDLKTTLMDQLEVAFSQFDTELLPAQVPITVIICTRNRAVHLQKALQSIQGLVCKPEEIIVVDNAPFDNSTASVVSQFEGITYCCEPRVGLDIARNTGIRMARKPIVAYYDDDVQLHPYWAYQVWKAFEQPAIAAMTGLVIAAELQTEAQRIFEKHWSFNRGYVDKIYDTAYLNKTLGSGPPIWEIGAGANMAFRRELFDKIGYFDERLDVGAAGCSGDSEIWYRILAHGYSIQYNPRAVVYHTHRQELKALQKQLFHYMRGHTAAALIQQQYSPQAGYYRHLVRLLRWYFHDYYRLFRNDFPSFPPQHPTLSFQLKGILSGLLFYINNRKRPSQPLTH